MAHPLSSILIASCASVGLHVFFFFAEDLVLAEVDAELLAQRLLDVDLGDDAEAFLLQRLGRALNRFVEPCVEVFP